MNRKTIKVANTMVLSIEKLEKAEALLVWVDEPTAAQVTGNELKEAYEMLIEVEKTYPTEKSTRSLAVAARLKNNLEHFRNRIETNLKKLK